MRFRLPQRRWDADESPKTQWERLNEGWRDIVNLVKSMNNATRIRTVTFTGPAAVLTFASDTSKRPDGVVLVGLYRTDSGATTGIAFSWTYANGQVSTNSFSALAATEWRATFQIIGGV